MKRYDPIPDITKFGYTWREAAFLHLVGTTSGFFLYRQYCDFINRKLGALAQQLVEKGVAAGHIEALPYGQRRHVYHLKSRTIYAILGNSESDYHRQKGDAEVKTRLMILDYLLANRKQPFLALEQEKIEFFLDSFSVPKSILPSRLMVAPDGAVPLAMRYFPERFPIHPDAPSSATSQTVRFTYIDYGALSVKRFARFLENHRSLIEKLGAFGIVYVADSTRNLVDAERAFERFFPRTSRLFPFGLEHITNYLTARALWDKNDPRFSQQDLVVLKEGERVYKLPEHADLQTAWLKGNKEFGTQLTRMGEKQLVRGRFSSHILECTYPVFGYRYRGKAAAKPAPFRFGSSSDFNSIAS